MKKKLLSAVLAAAIALALQAPAAMPVHAKARSHVKTIYLSSQHDITNDGKKDRVKVQTKKWNNGVYFFKVYVNGKKIPGALNYNVNYGKCKANIINVGGKSFLTTRFDATLSGDSGRLYQYKKGKFVTVIDPWKVLNVSDYGFFRTDGHIVKGSNDTAVCVLSVQMGAFSDSFTCKVPYAMKNGKLKRLPGPYKVYGSATDNFYMNKISNYTPDVYADTNWDSDPMFTIPEDETVTFSELDDSLGSLWMKVETLDHEFQNNNNENEYVDSGWLIWPIDSSHELVTDIDESDY
ncbi:MAG: hypothetical protein LKE86_00075 [Eubacterium sp.]|jgi:hypothetical protein|nr:hypothetical protein [Eubacterium sp.]MCH4045849.1 hypothetical protein [Eubacterium sp.]MCH4078940.1 hypothetical protein [Eubacterium sp.]